MGSIALWGESVSGLEVDGEAVCENIIPLCALPVLVAVLDTESMRIASRLRVLDSTCRRCSSRLLIRRGKDPVLVDAEALVSYDGVDGRDLTADFTLIDLEGALELLKR